MRVGEGLFGQNIPRIFVSLRKLPYKTGHWIIIGSRQSSEFGGDQSICLFLTHNEEFV